MTEPKEAAMAKSKLEARVETLETVVNAAVEQVTGTLKQAQLELEQASAWKRAQEVRMEYLSTYNSVLSGLCAALVQWKARGLGEDQAVGLDDQVKLLQAVAERAARRVFEQGRMAEREEATDGADR